MDEKVSLYRLHPRASTSLWEAGSYVAITSPSTDARILVKASLDLTKLPLLVRAALKFCMWRTKSLRKTLPAACLRVSVGSLCKTSEAQKLYERHSKSADRLMRTDGSYCTKPAQLSKMLEQRQET